MEKTKNVANAKALIELDSTRCIMGCAGVRAFIGCHRKRGRHVLHPST
jgi:hypothetical protein